MGALATTNPSLRTGEERALSPLNLLTSPDNNYPNRLFDVQVTGTGNMIQVPITKVARKYYGCPTDEETACNGLYNYSTLGNGYYDQGKDWLKKFCIYPPINHSCKGGPAIFNDNYHNYERHVSTLFSGTSAHETYDCDTTKCNYHTNPDKLNETCTKPTTGKSCAGDFIALNYSGTERVAEVADCPAGYIQTFETSSGISGYNINTNSSASLTTQRKCALQNHKPRVHERPVPLL